MHNDVPNASRLAARVILINPDKQVLYLRASEPREGHVFWVMPGGGLELNESFEAAAKREGVEETGCSFELGPYVWFRRHQHTFDGRLFDQYERFFVALAADSTYQPAQPDRYISGYKWWSLDELLASADKFSPSNVRELIGPILNGDYPKEPFDCGV
ncbi:MAG: NUDIX domain-containing protein [Cyanobacteria bacterium J06632_3]